MRRFLPGWLGFAVTLTVGASLMAGSVDELKLRAGSGEVASQLALGMMYSRGLGVPANRAEGTRWLSMAARQGNAAAKSELARMTMGGGEVAGSFASEAASKPTAGFIPEGAGTLDVQTTPPGAAFSAFSGYRFVFSGVTPFHATDVGLYVYSVCFEKEGYELFWKTVAIEDQTPTVSVSLKPLDPQRAAVSCLDANKQANQDEAEERHRAYEKKWQKEEQEAAEKAARRKSGGR